MLHRTEILDRLSSTLQADQLPLHASFIEAGGDSLLAVQLTDELNAAHGIDIDPWALFESETLAEFVQHVLHADGTDTSEASGKGLPD